MLRRSRTLNDDIDIKNLPRCTIDDPLEIVADEIGPVAGHVNTLLKSTYLVGLTRDVEGTFHSFFDIAEEIAGIDCAAYLAFVPESNIPEGIAYRGIVVPREEERRDFSVPALLARRDGKAVLLDSARIPVFGETCRLWGALSLAAFPLMMDREVKGAIVFGKNRSHPFTTLQLKLLWLLAMQADNYLLQSEGLKSLSFYSFIDPLTHLYNRRHFDIQILREILRSRRTGKPTSLLILDIDGFKAYNDRFLHTAGDIALQELSSAMRESIREVDTVARLGGDEFAIILVETGCEGARGMGRRILDRIAGHLLPGAGDTRTEKLTASIGISTFPSDAFDQKDLMQKADRALYSAKRRGGGRLCLFQDIGEEISTRRAGMDIPIQKVYDASRSVVDMDKFLEILLFTAMQGLSVTRGSIVVTEPSGGGGTLRAAIGFGTGEGLAPGTSMEPGPVTSWVVEHGRPLLVREPKDLPIPKTMRKNGYRTDSFISLPLIHEGTRLGAIHLTNKRDREAFTPQDLEAFRPIAAQISFLLSQGMTFRQTVRDFSVAIFESLTNALELRYPFLSGHNGRVRDLSIRIAQRLGLASEEQEPLGTAALLHDIGIVGVPGSILTSRRKLSPRELDMARRHPLYGATLLEGVPSLEGPRRMILEHQERVDGSGYPYGLLGDEISPGARILAVAEFFDSVVSERPYRSGHRMREAVQMVRKGANTMFDPEVVTAFLGMDHTGQE